MVSYKQRETGDFNQTHTKGTLQPES